VVSPTFPEVSRLHEKTVQEAERHAAQYNRRPRKPPEVPGLSHVTVHPTVWETALDLAEGNWRRIQILSATEVIVANREVR
jgi:hypothetical protein